MDIISTEKLPEKGLVMAYFKNELLFSPYEVTEKGLSLPEKALFDAGMPYECHFFDEDREYRLVRRSARNDVIEKVLSKEQEEEMSHDLIFTEDVLVKKEYADIPGIPEKLRVINRYGYSENDTLVLRDYRLSLIPM